MKKVLKIVVDVILWLFVALAALLTIMVFTAQKNKDGLPNVFGNIPITVQSDSMNPTFKTGDLIIDKALTSEEKEKLQVGDVITFYSDLDGNGTDEINTHRIVAVSTDEGHVMYTTRGDNTATNTKDDDSRVHYSTVLGKYTGTKLGGVGKVLSFLQTPNGFLIVIVLPLVLFFLFELYRFIAAVVAAKSKGVLTADQEEEIRKKAVEEYLKQKQDDGSDSEDK